jgi:hypothetical protein
MVGWGRFGRDNSTAGHFATFTSLLLALPAGSTELSFDHALGYDPAIPVKWGVRTPRFARIKELQFVRDELHLARKELFVARNELHRAWNKLGRFWKRIRIRVELHHDDRLPTDPDAAFEHAG